MEKLLMVALGGGLGSVLRWQAAGWAGRLAGDGFWGARALVQASTTTGATTGSANSPLRATTRLGSATSAASMPPCMTMLANSISIGPTAISCTSRARGESGTGQGPIDSSRYSARS